MLLNRRTVLGITLAGIVCTLSSSASAGEKKDIVDTAVAAGQFKTLAAALQAADLVDALKGKGPFTVFAPTDEAFSKLPKGTVESLLKPENIDQLKQILLYHVVAGRVYSDQALQLKEAPSLAGPMLKISAGKNGAFINKSKLTALDIEASNGVVHVIDAVLMPPAKKVTKADAKVAIEHAVARGTALYNSGHTDACARHYMTTTISLLDSNHEMPAHAVRHLQTAMQHAKQTTCSDSQSWTMRHGLDAAYRVMMTDIR